MSIEQQGELQLTRRQLFVAGGALFLAGAFGNKVLEGVFSSETDEVPESRPYLNGESIATPYGDVRVDGWRVGVPQQILDESSKDGAEVSFRLIDQVDQSSISTFSSYNFSAELDKEGDTVNWMNMLPNRDGEPVLLVMSVSSSAQKGAQETSQTFRISPKVYTDTGSEHGRVFSQYPASTKQLRDLADIGDLFRAFDTLSISPVYFVNSGPGAKFEEGSSAGGVNIYTSGVIVVSSRALESPQFKDEASQIVFHEHAHDLMRVLLSMDGANRPSYVLSEYYKKIASTYDGDRQGEITLNDILTESTYIVVEGYGRGRSNIGHPEDNFNEMFASTLSVLRFHADGFLDNFSKLKKQERELIAGFVGAVIESLGVLNKDQKALEDLLPGIQKIKKALGIS